jgi:hypothetical protein
MIYLRLDGHVIGEDTANDRSTTSVRTALNSMRAWVGDMGGLARFRSLQDVNIVVICRCYDDVIRLQGMEVKLEKGRGLTVKRASYHLNVREPYREDFKGWFTASAEMRRQERGWLGEGIIDFILNSEESWSEMWIRYPDGEHGERRIMSDPLG